MTPMDAFNSGASISATCITNLGCSLVATIGGMNKRQTGFSGRRPLVAGSGEFCPPPLSCGCRRGAGSRMESGILIICGGMGGGGPTAAAASSNNNSAATWRLEETSHEEIG